MLPNYQLDLFTTLIITFFLFICCSILLLNFGKTVTAIRDSHPFWTFCLKIFLGATVGLLSLYYFYSVQTPNVLFVFALLIPTIFLFDLQLQIGTYISFFFCSFVLWDKSELFIFLQVVFLFCILFQYLIILMKNVKRIIQICIFQVIMFILFFSYVQFFDEKIFSEKWQINNTVFYLCIFTFILQTIAIFFDNLFKKTTFLKHNVQYSNEIFVNASFAKKNFYEFISKHNVSCGFLFIFASDENGSDQEKRFLRSERANKFWKMVRLQFLPHKTFFFKTKNNNFGVFIPYNGTPTSLNTEYGGNVLLSRDTADIFSKFEKILKDINDLNSTDIANSKTIGKISLHGSIYGIHSNDIDTLVANSELTTTANETTVANSIVCFNPNNVYTQKNTFIKYLELIKIIDSSKIKVLFNTTMFNNTKVYYPYYFYNGLLSSSSKIDLLKKAPEDLQETFLRHLSAKAVKQYSKNVSEKESIIAFDYPLSAMSENFDVKQMKKFLNNNNISPEKACLVVDLDHLLVINEKIIHSLEKLTAVKILYAFKNIDESHYDLCAQLKPVICFAKRRNVDKEAILTEYLASLKKLYLNININICDPI